MDELKYRLSLFIKACYKTAKNLHVESKINYSQLSDYRQGTSTPTVEVLIRLCEAGMSIDWYLCGIGDMFADNEKGNELKRLAEQKAQEYFLVVTGKSKPSPVKKVTMAQLDKQKKLSKTSTSNKTIGAK